MLNFARGPFKDLRVRQAANYAINRQDVVEMLGGTAIPEHDVVPITATRRPMITIQPRHAGC